MPLLLCRTWFHLLTAPCSPTELCEAAVQQGHDHLVLCDSNALYGLLPFVQECARVGLQAVLGSELVHGGRRAVVIARDRTGYRSLCALLTARQLDADFDLPRAIAAHAAGTFVLCGDLRLLPELAGRVPADQLFVMLPPRGMPDPVPAVPPAEPAGRKLPDPAPPAARAELLDAAAVLGLRAVAAREVWFARPEDHGAHLLFLAVKHNRVLRTGGGDPAQDLRGADLRGVGIAYPTMHLPPRQAHGDGFDDQPAARELARELRAGCTLTFAQRSAPVFPDYHLQAGELPPHRLRQLAEAGLRRRGRQDEPAAAARLQRELAVIEAMGFAPYFLVVHEIVELARARDIPFVGRGSAADSLVSYCLGLTDADPLRYGLLFERFLNPGRNDLPDIDLDFCWRRRDELLAAVYAHFGHDRVAMIATYNRCGPRAAYAEAAKAAGLPPDEATARSQRLPWHVHGELDLAACIADTPGFHRKRLLAPERERAIVAAAQRLLAAPRHLGVHPGGVVMTPDAIAGHAPLERAQKGVVVTQFDMHAVEWVGLVKIDLLGNRALSIVHDCRRMLGELHVDTPALDQIAEDDAATAELLSQGRTLACFQVESPAMRTLLVQMQAATMDRVIQAIALVRPGPASSGMKDAFVRRARGFEPPQAEHPLLLELFAGTFGIMLYQEDVIAAAMAVAGLDGTGGDELRRRLGKRQAGGADLDAFVVAGLRRGLPRPALERIWAEMARFAGYSFCKAHAVTYGRIAYHCVYLKARWPAAFLCAMLRNDAGYYDKGVYVEECKRLGVKVLAPCVNVGDPEFALLDRQTIRVGLQQVHGLRDDTLRTLLAARRAGGPFRSFDDFTARVRPARDEAEHLILCGALDALGTTRPELLWRLQLAHGPGGHKSAAAALATRARGTLLPEALAPRDVAIPALPEFDLPRRMQSELAVLGFALDAHPVDVLWQHVRRPRGCVPCAHLAEHLGHRVSVFGWVVATRGHRVEQAPMLFLTLEDGTGIVEATLFHQVYRECAAEIEGRGPYLVTGVVEERLGGLGLRVVGLRREDGGAEVP